MAETFKKLYQGQVPSTATTLYTVPASTSSVVKSMRIVNTSTTTSITIKLWNGGTTDAYVILPATSIDAGGFAEFEGTFTMAAADTLAGQAGSASSITLTVWGVEIT